MLRSTRLAAAIATGLITAALAGCGGGSPTYPSSYGYSNGYSQSPYTSNSGYGNTTGYGSTGAYGSTSGYGNTTGYGSTGAYGSTSGYGNTTGYGSTGAYGSTTGYGSTYGSTPGYGSTYGSTAGAQLTATVSNLKNGVFLGIGDCVATVSVNNPSSMPLTGTLTVTFTNGGQPTSDVQIQQVSLAAGQTQSFTFTDTKWSTDNATVQITTNPATPTGGYGTTPAYGSTMSNASTYGTGTTGTGSTYGGY